MKVYTVYCTTCKDTGRYYIGVHKTSKPNDEYLGSGTILKNAVKKYGASRFVKEVLQVYQTIEAAFAREELLVRVHRRFKKCMNLRKGGAGGFDYIHKQGISQKLWADPEFRAKQHEKLSAQQKLRWQDPIFRAKSLLRLAEQGKKTAARQKGKKRSTETRQKCTISHTNRKWMMRRDKSTQVKPEDIKMMLANGWAFGKKLGKPKLPKRKKRLVHKASSFRSGKCKCNVCHSAYNDYMRAYMQKYNEKHGWRRH